MTGADTSKAHFLRVNLSTGAVLVTLDARSVGVQVPEHLRGDGQLVLRLGYDLSPRIPDLEVGDTRVAATLTFNDTLSRVEVPYHAVYRITGKSDMVWVADVPVDVAEATAPAPAPKQEPAPTPPSKPRPSHLRLVP